MKEIIEKAWIDRSLLKDLFVQNAVKEVIEALDKGKLRVAEPINGQWIVNEWVKKAVLLYFPIQQNQTIELGPFEYHDKIPLKRGFAEQQVRVVPQAIARYGSYLAQIGRAHV